MTAAPLTLDLPNEDATARLGVALGQVLKPGDVLLLEGSVGAGKTHLARALIQSLLLAEEDVPSPTFTLVQTYDTTKGALWHADLYRLTDSAEVEELGLTEAFETAISLVEWPDRLGEEPPGALTLSLSDHGAGRAAHLTWTSGAWSDRLAEGMAHV